MKQPSIDQYLLSTCLHIIDEFDQLYANISTKEGLKIIADDKYNEMDITVKIGYPFKNLVHYTVSDDGHGTKEAREQSKLNHDLYIESKDFKMEVKYLKNWLSTYGNKSNKIMWNTIKADFQWLFDEINNGNKNKRAFILGWFNCVNSFSSLMQLGRSSGKYPLVDGQKLLYFPFLIRGENVNFENTKASDLEYNYSCAYQPKSVELDPKRQCHCLFLGNEDNKFHFAIYY